ncbi:hypothetical protein E2562_002328 [Oryza meyeriana var. granulata]|uniref:Uncharacterized protein n=1 Tax=Oryza meyeriana var. granulata TaxID=110450 RepID=A0A6G1BIJ8_9ORYZ|nr:hypothetical protein E2562_002328 [Oryza meyeriana var. granulata]
MYYIAADDDNADKKVSHPKDSEINLVRSLNIFYGIVLGQGILYILACLLEVFSFIPRRSLIRRAGFRVLAAKKISFVNFALDSLNSSDSSSRKKLYGVKVLHIFLTKESFRAETIQKLTASTQTMASLFSMLGWTSNGDKDIRLFTAKVIAELAGSLQVVPISGAMQLVTSLLDNPNHQPKISDSQDTPILNYWKQVAMYCLIPVDEPSDSNEQNSRIVRCWKWMTKCWSIPEEEPSKDQDFLPVQGLIILERLASFDSENCMEISRSTSLISKDGGSTVNGREDTLKG